MPRRWCIPAHTLKGESRQFGAEPLADLAEAIETIARDCVETRDTPDEALEHVVQLRPLFEETLTLLEREANPLVEAVAARFRRARSDGFGDASPARAGVLRREQRPRPCRLGRPCE